MKSHRFQSWHSLLARISLPSAYHTETGAPCDLRVFGQPFAVLAGRPFKENDVKIVSRAEAGALRVKPMAALAPARQGA
jgi:hypothetical protein